MVPDFGRWIESIWLLVGVYWLLAASRLKPVVRRESWRTRTFTLAILAAACALLFSSTTSVGVLAFRLLPQLSGLGWVGLGLTATGCAFAVWARVRLGSNWSASVTRKQQHELVRSGPYAIVRHPIYAGFLLAILGTALAQGELRALMALALAFVAWWAKACLEERFLVEEFGGAYTTYCRQVSQLIPFVF
jgi:protein-S-isoprenylcysteine O-methyltransferase Ste14